MLGIIWDVNKFAKDQRDFLGGVFEDEIEYLRRLVQERDQKISQLQDIIFKHVGVIRSESTGTIEGVVPVNQVRTWKGLKSKLEEKFRPPELADREEKWKRAAAVAAVEVEENAS